jgi:hypothetical protein
VVLGISVSDGLVVGLGLTSRRIAFSAFRHSFDFVSKAWMKSGVSRSGRRAIVASHALH